MRILIVGLVESVHTGRFVRMLSGLGWDVHLFPSTQACRPHAELRDVTVYLPPQFEVPGAVHECVRLKWLPEPPGENDVVTLFGWHRRAELLAGVVEELQPDLVHSHEMRHAGYLTLDAREHTRSPFPPWLVTNWGSDIFWWGRHPAHVDRIKALMRAIDFYACECHRDAGLARAFGFRGKVLPIVPIPGGFDLEALASLRAPGRTSERRTIALKGYNNLIGRAEVAVEALDRCADALRPYRLAVYLAAPEVVEGLERVSARSGAELEVVSTHNDDRPHEDILAMHGRARVSIGLNRSDGTSVSFLEALAMGAFPVQSDTACAGEYTVPGVGGLFVPADDPDALAAALRVALTDDALVDRGAVLNLRLAAAHLDRRTIRARVIDAYERVVVDGAQAQELAPA
jgi:glycosyltransferase involved in cell wall biosynthesis